MTALNNTTNKKSYGIDENTIFMLHGETIRDYSGKGNVTFEDKDIAIANQGKFNKAFRFDGDDRKLEIKTSGIAVGTGDFTLDFWIFMRDKQTHQDIFTPPISDWKEFTVAYANEKLRITCGEQDEWCNPVPDFRHKWNHIAIVRKEGNLRTYVNGKLVLDTTSARDIQIQSIIMGYHQYNTSFAADVDIDEVRFSNIARWTEEFEPPSVPYNDGPPAPNFGLDENVKLMLNADSFMDTSFNPIEITHKGAGIVSGKFNKAFDLSVDKIMISNDVLGTKLDMTGEFTIDMWIMPNSSKALQVIVDSRSTTKNGFGITLYEGRLCTTKDDHTWELQSNYKPPIGEWTHVAYTRTSENEVMLFANGVLIAKTEKIGSVLNQGLTIGNNQSSGTEKFEGLVDEFRISDKCRWNRNFIPPSTPYIRNIDFNVYNSGVEFIIFGANGDVSRINSVTVYVNGNEDTTYTTGFNTIKHKYKSAPPQDSNIKITCIFDNEAYGLSKELPYAKMTPLESTAGLTDVFARQFAQLELIEMSKNRLMNILESKGQLVKPTMKLSELVELVLNL